MKSREEKMEAFGRLLDIMDELREKCPWDRKQTFQSLRNLTIEETFELADALVDQDPQEIKEEIGDIFLHMVFYSKIGEEKGAFDVADTLHSVCDKLINRHPHIYGDLKVDNAEMVKQNWEKIKLKEGKKSVLSGVPRSLTAMIKAFRLQDKTAQVGFEWENTDDVWSKVHEEIGELEEAYKHEGHERTEEELGDVFFSLINFARFTDIDPELALEKVNRKFIERFEYIEARAPRPLEDMSLAEMDALWNEAKGK